MKTSRTFNVDGYVSQQFNEICRKNHEVKSQVIEDLMKVFITEHENENKKRGSKNRENNE